MQDPDCYLSFGQEPMRSWVGIEVGKVIKDVCCVVMSVRVSVMCCGSVQHNYYSNRADFLLKLQEKLGNGFERFDALDSLGKSSFILGNELWEEHFDSLLPLVKDYVVDIWEGRKISLSPQPGIWGNLLGLSPPVL